MPTSTVRAPHASAVASHPARRRHRPHRRHRVCANAGTRAIDVSRARGGDYNAAAATFVSSFFYDGEVDERDVEYQGLVRSCASDMKRRYSARVGDASALVVVMDANDSKKCLACGGIEVRRYVGAMDYETMVKSGRGGGNVEERIRERPIVANLATAREARRRGYGKAVMRALEEECAELGFDECCLVVEARNRRAQSLYKKLGYKVIGSERKAAALEVVDGRAVETTTKTLIMRKSLTNPAENIDVATVGAVLALLAFVKVQQDAVLDLLFDFGINLY